MTLQICILKCILYSILLLIFVVVISTNFICLRIICENIEFKNKTMSTYQHLPRA